MDGQVKNQSEPLRWKILRVINIHCVLLTSDANYESHLQYLSEDSRETLSEPCHQYSHFQEQQGQQRHSQSVTSVIINPVAVEDFRSRVEGRVVVEGSGRERGAMNSSGSGSGGEGGGKFIVPGLFCFLPFYYLSVISRWFRGEQGEPGRAAHPKFHADLGEEEQEEEQPVHPLRQGQGEVRGEETHE